MFIAILRTGGYLEGNRSFCVSLNALSPASANDEACRIASALTTFDCDGWVYSVHDAIQASGDPKDTAAHLLAIAVQPSGETR